MIRSIIILFTIANVAVCQDSAIVRRTCERIQKIESNDTIKEQLQIVMDETQRVIPDLLTSSPGDHILQELYRFQFKLNQELKRSCAGFLIEPFIPTSSKVVDIEGEFDKPQIDSLKSVLLFIGRNDSISIQIVTVDDFFPDSSVDEFCSRQINRLQNMYHQKKGNVVVVISKKERIIRTQTNGVGQQYLTDIECKQINQTMIPYFRRGEYFQGLLKGLGLLRSLI